MRRILQLLIVLPLAIPIVCAATSSYAADITVRNETELGQAVMDANAGTYNNIIIDARHSGNTFEILNTPSVNAGNYPGYTFTTFQDTAVTFNGEIGRSAIAFDIAGDNDYSARKLITFNNISFRDFDVAISSAHCDLDFTGWGDLRFDNCEAGLRMGDRSGALASTVQFKNLGSVVFENGGYGIDSGYGHASDIKIAFLNGKDVIFRNLTEYGIGSGFTGAEFVFRNGGNVIFDSIAGMGFDSMNSHLVDFDNDGDVIFSDTRAGAFNVNFSDATFGARADRFNNRGDVAFLRNTADWWSGSTTGNGAAMHLYLEGSEDYSMTLTNTGDTVFMGNRTVDSGGSIGAGGAIRFRNDGTGSGDLTFAGLGNTWFHNNIAGTLGGGIFFYSGHTPDKGSITFAPSGNNIAEFKNNWQNVSSDADGNLDFSAARSNSLYIQTHGNIYLTPEENASILFRDPIVAESDTLNNIKIIQNGSGTTRLWNGWDYADDDIAPALLGGTVILENGRFLAMDNAVYTSGTSPEGVAASLFMTTKADATLGFSVDESGGHSLFNTESFTVQDGANLYVTGISKLNEGEQFRDYQNVVESVDPINGSLSTMKVDNDFMHAELVKNGNHLADLHVYRVNSVESQLGSNSAFLDEMRLNPELPDVLRWELDDLYNDGVFTSEMEELFHVASGTDVLNAMNAMRTNGRLFHQTMVNRMDEVNERAGSYCRLPPGHLLRLCSRNIKSDQLWGTFTKDWTEQDGGFLRSGYSYRPTMFAVGKDHHYGPWTGGIAFQYGHGTTYSGDRSYANTETDTATLGLYAGRNYGKNYLKVTAQAGLGYNETKTHYGTLGLDADADFLSGTLGAGLEFGRVIRFGCATHPWDITPHIGAEYLFIGSESFTESGGRSQPNHYGINAGHNLTRGFQGVRYNVVEIPIGFRVAKTFQVACGLIERLRPSVDLMYVRSAGDNVASTKVRFLDSPSYPWTINGTGMGRDALRMNVGLAMKFAGDWDLDVSYGLETRRHHDSQQLNASLSRRW